MKTLTEDEFDTKFTVVPNDDGETIRPTSDGIDPDSKHLWTILDGDEALYASSGFHYVNRVGYLLTVEAWTEETEAVWQEFSPELDDDVAELPAPQP